MSYLMAIDAGTGSIRAAIFDTKGNQISVAQEEWTHLAEDGVANSMSFDFEKNWGLTVGCIKKAISLAGISGEDILAVSATSMREIKKIKCAVTKSAVQLNTKGITLNE